MQNDTALPTEAFKKVVEEFAAPVIGELLEQVTGLALDKRKMLGKNREDFFFLFGE
jgi:hypothetical protein